MVSINGYEVEVDILDELGRYDWAKAKVRGDKFLACSPFRTERHPSFAVRLDTGVWIDSGAEDEEWKKGNIVKLLSWFRNETYNETADYLLTEYCPVLRSEADSLRLNINLEYGPDEITTLDNKVLFAYRYRHNYLAEKRGISEDIQQAFRVGYDPKTKAVTFPWMNRTGDVVNIKFRSVKDKRFWYYTGGLPIRDHVYGIHMLNRVTDRERVKQVYITESEIDCLTLWQYGFGAVALGGANMTRRQRDLLLQSPAEEYVIATDNDQAGRRIADSIAQELNGYRLIKVLHFPSHIKDINDMSKNELNYVKSSLLSYDI